MLQSAITSNEKNVASFYREIRRVQKNVASNACLPACLPYINKVAMKAKSSFVIEEHRKKEEEKIADQIIVAIKPTE